MDICQIVKLGCKGVAMSSGEMPERKSGQQRSPPGAAGDSDTERNANESFSTPSSPSSLNPHALRSADRRIAAMEDLNVRSQRMRNSRRRRIKGASNILFTSLFPFRATHGNHETHRRCFCRRNGRTWSRRLVEGGSGSGRLLGRGIGAWSKCDA